MRSHSLGYDYLPIQDHVNRHQNIMAETLERNLPLTLVNAAMLDVDVLNQRSGSAGELVPVLAAPGQSLRESAYNLPQPTVAPQASEWVQEIHAMGREVIGALPSIYGGESSHQITALEADNRLSQALMQLGLPWNGMRRAWKGAFTNALRALLKSPPEKILSQYGVTPIDLNNLEKSFDESGNLTGIEINVQESIPATPLQLRNALAQVMQLGPQAWSLVGIDSPQNAQRLRDALGLHEWRVPGQGPAQFIRRAIQEILADPQAPLPNPEGIEFVIDPPLASMLVQDWLISDEGEGVRTVDMNQWAKVLEWGKSWRELAMQSAMAQGPTGEQGAQGSAQPSGPNGGMMQN